ncbi:hypothetical protein AX16_003993 [Volvariella volvacea WC 439]|nr:hypothetical protein AX16_003993 [Volvariella volvacea WC 439]
MTTQPTKPVQQQQPRVRKPPFADWPTIKILTPPGGRFSTTRDEWCFTYCSQNVHGRIYGKEPRCRSICVRRVFPHEVKNIASFKAHQSVGPDGKARYPLPAEGQAANVPLLLGGKPVKEEEDEFGSAHEPSSSSASSSAAEKSKKPTVETKYWDEGWYVWTSKSRWAVYEKTDSMRMDLGQQQQMRARRDQQRELWQDYQDHLQQRGDDQTVDPSSKWWGPIVPAKPFPDTSSQSLLVPLPPDWPPVWDRIAKLLAPTHKVLGILQESITSGEQKKFALRVWEKAWTNEPFILVSRTFEKAYERWKERDNEADEDSP